MKFHLNLSAPKPDYNISHKDRLFLIGSCFSEHISQKLLEQKFKVFSSPNGSLFNPLSIRNSLLQCIHSQLSPTSLFLERDNVYYSYLHHSSIQASSNKQLEALINKNNYDAQVFLKSAQYVFITFGTAYYYVHKGLQTVVANCHKQAAEVFDKNCLEVERIVDMYTELLRELKHHNPELKVVFTVSPVKHLRDGFIENNLSKAILLLSVHKLCNTQNNCFYFPAYELVNDDLRDYRFYKEDLAHPNQMAIDYVWEKFSDCFFDMATQQLNHEIEKLNKVLRHKPLSSETATQAKHHDFIARQSQIIKELFPEMEF